MKQKFNLKKATPHEVPNIAMIGTLCLELISLRGQLNLGPTSPKTQQTTPDANPQAAEITPEISIPCVYCSKKFTSIQILQFHLSKCHLDKVI